MNEQEAVSVGIIPDEIEPRIGYKYLQVGSDGTMVSPMYHMAWPPMKKAEANGCEDWLWEPHNHPPSDAAYYEAADFSIGSSNPTPPMVELPAGLNWYLVARTHEAPGEHCRCGIYAVAKPSQCDSYRDYDNSVLVELAIWGNVVPASQGVRGQYAYPKAIYAEKDNLKLAQKAAALYQVPLIAADKAAHVDLTIFTQQLTQAFTQLNQSFAGALSLVIPPLQPVRRRSRAKLGSVLTWVAAALIFAAIGIAIGDAAPLVTAVIYTLFAIFMFIRYLRSHG